MFLLRTFGGVALVGPEGVVAGAPAQRHRLALLMLLACPSAALVPRDKLLGLLWPEHDTSSARRLLNLAVHALRQVLGRDAIRSVGDGLQLNATAVECDAVLFHAALEGGDPRRAVELYRGPFLDGFFLPDAPEFDHCVDGLRAGFAQQHGRALEQVAGNAEAAGDWQLAADWWRRLVAVDPGNGRVVRRLMLSLEAAGDRAAALHTARSHAAFMAAEFSAEPDVMVSSLAESLRRSARPTPAASRPGRGMHTLAVLPFVEAGDLGPVTGMGEGLAVELRHLIPRLADVRVAAVEPGFRGRGRSMSEIGAALGVASVLEGTARRSGERVRVTAHLVDARRGFHLWSASYERPLGERFALEELLSAEIAQAVLNELGGFAADGGLDARGLVLRGRFALGRRTADSLRTAVRYFTEAIRIAPREPSGYSGLADAHALMGFYDVLPPAAAFTSARQAARTALGIDRSLGMPRATLAYADLYQSWNPARAEERFLRALRREPRNTLIHQWYGNVLTALGRTDEALRMMQRAAALDPQSIVASAANGWACYMGRQYERSVEHSQATIELDPGFALAYLWLGQALQELHRMDEAVAALARAEALLGHLPVITAAVIQALAHAGRGEEARNRLEELSGRPGYLPSYELAKAWFAVGESDLAYGWLERAEREGSHSLVFLQVDPQLDRVRPNPRFEALAGRVRPR